MKERKKTSKTTLYGKIKEKKETNGEWLIGVHSQNVFYLPTVTIAQRTTGNLVNSF